MINLEFLFKYFSRRRAGQRRTKIVKILRTKNQEMSIWELPMLCPSCMRFAIRKMF